MTGQRILQCLDAEGSFHRDRQSPGQNPAGRHMDPFWDKYSRLKPYLQPADKDEDHAREPSQGITASVVAFALLLSGATGVFAELQDAFEALP